MDHALTAARAAALDGEVPVGAVVVRDGNVIATAANATRTTCDATAHAEIGAIRRACRVLGDDRLSGCDLYVTLEPCAMCAGAIAHARIATLHYAAPDAKGGAVAHGARFFTQPTCHHRPAIVAGERAEEAAALLRAFFAERRAAKTAATKTVLAR